jgi:hypothetical protein
VEDAVDIAGGTERIEWAERMVEEVLPLVPYRQLIFTIPVALSNDRKSRPRPCWAQNDNDSSPFSRAKKGCGKLSSFANTSPERPTASPQPNTTNRNPW